MEMGVVMAAGRWHLPARVVTSPDLDARVRSILQHRIALSYAVDDPSLRSSPELNAVAAGASAKTAGDQDGACSVRVLGPMENGLIADMYDLVAFAPASVLDAAHELLWEHAGLRQTLLALASGLCPHPACFRNDPDGVDERSIMTRTVSIVTQLRSWAALYRPAMEWPHV